MLFKYEPKPAVWNKLSETVTSDIKYRLKTALYNRVFFR